MAISYRQPALNLSDGISGGNIKLKTDGDTFFVQKLVDGNWLDIQTSDETQTSLVRGVKSDTGNVQWGNAHTGSSCGQNIGFLNEFSEVEGQKMFFFPTWQAVSQDGATVYTSTERVFEDLQDIEINGAKGVSSVEFNFPNSFTQDVAVFRVTIEVAEDYTGDLLNTIFSASGVELYNVVKAGVSLVSGQELDIPYPYPYFVKAGDDLQFKLIKDDGTYLNTTTGTTDPTKPWRRLSSRLFADESIYKTESYQGTTDVLGEFSVVYGTAYEALPTVAASVVSEVRGRASRVVESTLSGFKVAVEKNDIVNILGTDVLASTVSPVVGSLVNVVVSQN